MFDGGSTYMKYSAALAATTGSGAGKTSPATVNINGTVANADYVDLPAGAYTDTLTVTISP